MTYRLDDVAVFLALYREGTTVRAAACLGCSQPTVVRRIAAFEAAIGLTLFDRTPTGFVATKSAAAILGAAEALEASANRLDAEIRTTCGDPARTVRLTLLDHFERLFVPILSQFRECWPDVRVELLVSDRIYDVARGEADIAVRGRSHPDDDAIVTRRLPDCTWSLYAPADMPREKRPTCWEDVDHHLIALPSDALARLPIYTRLAEVAERSDRAMKCSNYNSLRSAIISAHAVSALPLTVGDHDPMLVRCFDPPAEYDGQIFLIGRRASLRQAHIRQLFESIDAYFSANPELLTGRRQ